MTFRDYWTQFAAAWRFFVPRRTGGEYDPADHPQRNLPPLMRPMTPLAGTLLGLCAALPVFLISFSGRIPAALAGGLLAPLIPEILTRGKGLLALAGYVDSRRSGTPQEEALSGGNGFTARKPFALFPPAFILYLFRASTFAALCAFSREFWIVVSLTGGYLVRAELSTLRSGGGTEIFPADSRIRNIHWWTGFCAMLAAMLMVSPNPVPMLPAIALVWLIGTYGVHLCAGCMEDPGENPLHIFGYASELALLLLGVLLYARV